MAVIILAIAGLAVIGGVVAVVVFVISTRSTSGPAVTDDQAGQMGVTRGPAPSTQVCPYCRQVFPVADLACPYCSAPVRKE
jgi:hypothetical protein